MGVSGSPGTRLWPRSSRRLAACVWRMVPTKCTRGSSRESSSPSAGSPGGEGMRLLALWCAAAAVACARPPGVVSAEPAPAGMPPAHYERPEMWLCRPDLPNDACRVNLDATELRPDGSRVVVPFVTAAKTSVDCFYVYPTVDLTMVPGN